MTKEEMYQKHIETMFGIKDIATLSRREVDEAFDNLIGCMPNGGKMYKYRRIGDEKSFGLVYKSLQDGTLWSSRVDKFSDKTDCTIHYDPTEDAQRIERLFKENPEFFIGLFMRGLSKQVENINPQFDDTMLLRMSDCFDKESGELKMENALGVFSQYGCRYEDSLKIIPQLNKKVQEQIKNIEPILKEVVEEYMQFNKKIRHRAFVCSLCEDYKVKTMWEHYAGDCGICIEYDFNKIKALTLEDKRFFCSTYKIIYVDEYEKYTFIPLLREMLKTNADKTKYKDLNIQFLKNTITKTSDYAYEKEWRLFHFNLIEGADGAPIKADIVSTIVIDENALDTDYGKKIIDLCRQKGWGVKVRKLNAVSTGYIYDNYSL